MLTVAALTYSIIMLALAIGNRLGYTRSMFIAFTITYLLGNGLPGLRAWLMATTPEKFHILLDPITFYILIATLTLLAKRLVE